MSSHPHTIAVGFDGSPDARGAATWALETAALLRAHVVLVYARGLLERHRDPAREFALPVGQLVGRAGFSPLHLSWHVGDGDALSVLLRATEAPVFADLLVVGSRGRDEHAGRLLGSTSLQLAERSPVPVVIVPTGHALD